MIGIRTDANDKIAMGHLTRCMSIARQLKTLNQEVVFILSEDDSGQAITRQGFRYLCMNDRYDQKEQETERLMEIIRQEKIQTLLIDSYEVTDKYMRELHKICSIIYIDDLNRFRYPADLIINYRFGADKELYCAKGYENEQFLLGSDYAPLRPEFSEDRIEIKKELSAIFLSTGGTDEFDLIVSVLRKLQNSTLKGIVKNVVTGRFYKSMDALTRMCQKDPTICHYHDIQDVCKVMRQSDLAVSAGGTTLTELCACGIPVIGIAIADNQLSGIRAYADAEIVLYAGDIRENREQMADRVIQMAELLKEDAALRERMGKKAKAAIDGKGAMRIAKAIADLQESY